MTMVLDDRRGDFPGREIEELRQSMADLRSVVARFGRVIDKMEAQQQADSKGGGGNDAP